MIPVYVHRPAPGPDGIDQTLEPLTFGVPLPRGRLYDPGLWKIASSEGSAPVAVTVLDRWSDGSIRWLLVDAQVPVGSAGVESYELRPSGEPVALPRLDVDEGTQQVTVDTGVLRTVIAPGASYPFRIAGAAGDDGDIRAALTVTDGAGAKTRATVDAVTVTHRSALRVCVRVDGHVVVGDRRLLLITRLEFFAGLPILRTRITIRNADAARHPGNYWDLGDPGSVLFEACSLEMELPRAVRTVEVSPEPGAPVTGVAAPVELYQDSSGGENWQSTIHVNRLRAVPNTFRGYRLTCGGHRTEGLRATPIVVATSGSRALGVAVPKFWQNFPRALEVRDAQVAVGLFPGQYADLHELQGGEQKTHACWLTFGTDVPAGSLEWARQPSRASATPEWMAGTQAVAGLAPLDPAHRGLVDQAVDGADTFEHKREVIDEYGWRHFGDVYGDHEAIGHRGPAPLVSHYNNQYDPVLGFGLQFLRTADARWWTAMDELAAHVIDIDIYHTDRDKSAYNGGLFWHTYHYGDADTSTHRTYPRRNTGKVFGGGPSADHNYPSGLLLHYYLTGDEASREAVASLAQYVINLEDWRLTPFRLLSHADTGRAIYTPPGYYGPSRSSGNSLNALVDGHRLTGEDRFLRKAEWLIRTCVHPTEDPGRHRLDDPEYRWFYTMFLQALGKYLVHRAEHDLIDDEYAYARASLLNYARWMADHEYPWLEKPEKLEFPTETWAAQDIRKSDIFCHAALHADGEERARFLERAAFFHRNSIDTLARMPTRSLARPVIVLLTSGHLPAWLQAQPEMVLPRPGREPDYGEPIRFVGQRAIAERRAKIIAAGGALAGAAALVGLAMWFF